MRFPSSFAVIATSTALLFAFGLGACVEKETEKVDEGYVKDNLLTAAPAPKHVSNADLGGKVIYLGADVDKTVVAPGDHFKVTHYWKVVDAVGTDWRPFTHLNGNTGGEWINIDKTKMRDNYGAERWKAGDIIRDEQTIPVPASWKSTEATVYVGLFRKGGHGEADRIAIGSGPTDGHNRAISVNVTVPQPGQPAAQSQPASAPASAPGVQAAYVIRRATGPITIDGKADEPDWANAPSTGPFKDLDGSAKVDGATSARLLYDDKNLYIFVDVADKNIVAEAKKHDDPMTKDDSISIYIDADKSGVGLIEIKVNPRNATADAWYAGTFAAGHPDQKWDSHAVSAVVVEGSLDKHDDADKAWHVELAIPLESVKGMDAAMAVNLPPRVGDTWQLNIVRLERPVPDPKKSSGSSWGPGSLPIVAFGDAKGQLGAPAAPASVPVRPLPTKPIHLVPGRKLAPGATR